MRISPILMPVFRHRFAAIAEEMGVSLNRTAYSPNIKERRDFSCAVFDRQGEMVAQAAHIPVHLGSMPLSVQAAIAKLRFEPGDMVMLNNPFEGGTHLPDITLVAPVFAEGDRPDFYVANRAHHSDVGGMTAGSMPLSCSLHQEGIIIPPVKIIKKGQMDADLMRFLLANVRTPKEREGDFTAQIMANHTGISRLEELLAKYGSAQVATYAEALNQHSERIMRACICALPNGETEFEDQLDDDGITHDPIRIHLRLRIDDDEVLLDFSQSSDQVKGSMNAVRAITLSASLYVFRSLVDDDIATNAGCQRPLHVITRPGSVLDAQYPAAVAGGNVETSQRIVDVILGALAQLSPERVPAAAQGSMNNVSIGGVDPRNREAFTYYETLAGGHGAHAQGPGESAMHSHMTNTLNTPVEAMEYSYPLRITEYALRRASGGQGAQVGGDGLIREIEMLSETEVTLLTDRRKTMPYGLLGGAAGQAGLNIRIAADGSTTALPGKIQVQLQAGERLRIETPGGGGYGQKPSETD
ncbi:N-methylhydantoinase B [Ectothiorhodosinus mongolicus]|uniref:N-methylhydantoinase B n=1 Tax=Ectothiorhodosinus mongolicus TaxID=233100 RepID=A0A1R3VZJ7_9GAMM|nr:hydantoinase B/oxoprolinase family protein [Ectothiorhodosinus mongolicus]ULX57230.1 5-oxoprolinase [Ectothiorhodosinus mongolicus]SIT70531.1 N-methylhydantoinase B [Ectothiorhodosinus mongolicus]